jgi:putative proteasome-type protease
MTYCVGVKLDEGDTYFDALTRQWIEGTRRVFRELPPLER